MDSTKLKIARTWNSQLSMLRVPVEIEGETQRVNPPIFMTRWLLTSTRQENAKGKFYNFGVKYVGLVEDAEVLGQALALREVAEGVPLRGKNGDLEEPKVEVGDGGSTDF
jgi:hypothetical protein